MHEEEKNFHRDNAAEVVLRGIRFLINLPFVFLRVLRDFVVRMGFAVK
jgi:hypothetical protein